MLKGVTQFGAKYPAQIWKAFMGAYHADLPPVEFAEAEPTRRGTSLKYTNKYDKGVARRRTTTSTTTPAAPPPSGTPTGGN